MQAVFDCYERSIENIKP
jgi:hypothetical protein